MAELEAVFWGSVTGCCSDPGWAWNPMSMDAATPPPDADARITLCVATRDRPGLVRRHLLPSLRGLPAGSSVLVVDQSSDDRTAELLGDVDFVVYLREQEPGLSRARNLAVRMTRAPLLAFTDDDVAFGPSWLESLAALFDADPEAGAVCGRGVCADGRLLPGTAAGRYRRPATPFRLGSGFNMAFRREALLAAGPFDEELGAGARYRSAEDTDMLYRVMREGWAVVCSDEITVVHDEWRGRREELRLHYGYGLGAGAQTAKHVAAGDGLAGRIALREARMHLATMVLFPVRGGPRAALLQPPYLAGMAAGFVSWRLAHRGASAGAAARR